MTLYRAHFFIRSFVSEINDFLSIMCSFSHLGKITNIHKINLISPKNAQRFYIEKYPIRDKLDFELKHVSGTLLVTDDSKIYEFLLSRVKMSVLDYVITRGQQAFEDGREINPIEIKIEDNRIRNFSINIKITG